MPELRWLLLAAGILVLGVVFWMTRRESAGKPLVPRLPTRRSEPALAPEPQPETPPHSPGTMEAATAAPADPDPGGPAPERIITVRLAARNGGTFAGDSLVLAMRDAGLRHGRFGIFHRHDGGDDGRTLFSVASLIEPGSFDLSKVKSDRYPGITLFMALPTGGDDVAVFDDMLATARRLAGGLDGEVCDDRGSRLSVQRERYLREEVIRFQHRTVAS